MAKLPSFQELVDRHYAALYRFAYSLTRHEAEAADLTQQTFLIWARRSHQLRDPAQAGAWLFTTLYREFLRERRRGEALPITTLNDEVAEEVPSLTPDAAQELDAALVQEALLGLEEGHRAVLSLFYLSGLKYREIAAVLEVPIGTVMSRVSRAKAELRQALSTRKQQSVSRPESGKTVQPPPPVRKEANDGRR